MKQIHRAYYIACVFVLFLFFYPVLYFLGRSPKRNYSHIVRIRRILAVWSSFITGICFKITYEQEIDWNKRYIIVANHTSNLDIAAIMILCPGNFSFIGKDELLENPVTGFFFKTVDIAVKRSSKISSFRAFKRAEEYLLSGKSVAIFPEGGISDEYPPRLQEFKNGGFKLAVDLKIPILPVVIEDAWKIHWDDGKKLGSKPGSVHIRVLTPADPGQLGETVEELRNLVHGKMENVLSSNNYSK